MQGTAGDPALPADVASNLRSGLLPFEGEWRAPGEIARRYRELRRHDYVVLAETGLLLTGVAGVSLVVFALVRLISGA